MEASDERDWIFDLKIKYIREIYSKAGEQQKGRDYLRRSLRLLYELSNNKPFGSYITRSELIARDNRLRHGGSCGLWAYLDFWTKKCGAGIVERTSNPVAFRIRTAYWNVVSEVLRECSRKNE